MARQYIRGEGHIPPGAVEPKEGQEKLKAVMEKVKKAAEAQREKEADALLDRLIAKAGGIDKVQQKLDARRTGSGEGQKQESHILSADQRAELAQGEKDAREVSMTRTEYKVDPNHPERVLSEIITGKDGLTKRIDYTYNEAGKVSQKRTEEMSGDSKTQTNEMYHYDADGKPTEEHGTRTIFRPGLEPMGMYRDVLYTTDSDPRLQDPDALKNLGKKYSFIRAKDANGAITTEYGYGPDGFSGKNNSGEYVNNSADRKTQFSYDHKGRHKTAEGYDGAQLNSRYSYAYQDRPDGSYTATVKDITPNKSKPDADRVQEYDSNGRLMAEQNFNGNVFSERTYTADGKLSTISRRVKLAEGVPDYTKINYRHGGKIYTAYTYDKSGRQESVTQKALPEA